MAIFFTSDTHYGHVNICAGVSNWDNKTRCRPYPNVEEMNDALVATINSRCKSGDILYHLGDWSFGGQHRIAEFRSRLDVGTIHLISGNHDHHQTHKKEKYLKLFASIEPYQELKVGKQEIVLFHYALRVWNNQGKGSWHLYGHSHGALPHRYNKSLDVGIDGAGMYHMVAPWTMEELTEVFSTESVPSEDYHDQSTQSPSFKGDKR